MHEPAPICLQFAPNVPDSIRARMDYAFRVFAAIYGHRVVHADSDENPVMVRYGGAPGDSGGSSRVLRVPALYRLLEPINQCTEKLARHTYAGEEFALFHGLDSCSGQPDWLGEIFEWLSGRHEVGISDRDSVGRLPDAQMVFARLGIPGWKPYATLLMGWLENSLRGSELQPALPRAPSPVPEVDHLVVCSHDVDFYFTTLASALRRLAKNLGVAVAVYRSLDYFWSSVSMIVQLLRGKRVGDYIPALLSRLEDFQSTSTFFVVPQQLHRRDPNYSLRELAPIAHHAAARGFAVEMHASYDSSVKARTLRADVAAHTDLLGSAPMGSRQHWLRFDNTESLYQMVAEAGLLFDSSVGFTDHVGFRSGASFAFPPYNFRQERPYEFLEIPLALMDGSLAEESIVTRQPPQFLADRVLGESRKCGWGGISILWHNPVEPLPVPEQINRVFWACAAKKDSHREKWISTAEFFRLCLRRYQDAGLLTTVAFPAATGNDSASGTGSSSAALAHSVPPTLRHAAKVAV